MRVIPVRLDSGKLGFKLEPENITDSNLLTEFELNEMTSEEVVDNNLTTSITFGSGTEITN